MLSSPSYRNSSNHSIRRSARFRCKVLNYWDFEKIININSNEGNKTVVVKDIPGEGTVILEKQEPQMIRLTESFHTSPSDNSSNLKAKKRKKMEEKQCSETHQVHVRSFFLKRTEQLLISSKQHKQCSALKDCYVKLVDIAMLASDVAGCHNAGDSANSNEELDISAEITQKDWFQMKAGTGQELTINKSICAKYSNVEKHNNKKIIFKTKSNFDPNILNGVCMKFSHKKLKDLSVFEKDNVRHNEVQLSSSGELQKEEDCKLLNPEYSVSDRSKHFCNGSSRTAALLIGAADDPSMSVEGCHQSEPHMLVASASSPEVEAVDGSTDNGINQLPQTPETLLIYPAPPQKDGISISVSDYKYLEEESFLNDVILDFYLKWLLLTKLNDERRNKVHLFSTFFYKSLTRKPKRTCRPDPIEDARKLSAAEKRHARVKSWTKGIDIFEKDFIIIPINEHSHWLLAIICFPGLLGPVHFDSGEPFPPEPTRAEARPHLRCTCRTKTPSKQIAVSDDDEWSDRDEAVTDEDDLEDTDEDDGGDVRWCTKKQRSDRGQDNGGSSCVTPLKQPCILILDSMSGDRRGHIIATLRDFLSVEHLQKKGEARVFNADTMKCACPSVPQQTNYTDCGLYTLQFAESFFELPPKDYRLPMRSISDWFDQSVVDGKRQAIAVLIKHLMNEYNPNNNVKLPDLYFNRAEVREKVCGAS